MKVELCTYSMYVSSSKITRVVFYCDNKMKTVVAAEEIFDEILPNLGRSFCGIVVEHEKRLARFHSLIECDLKKLADCSFVCIN